MTARQLAFPFPQAQAYDASAFMEDETNAEALAWIGRPQAWPDRRLAVFGEPGCGKTHLLHLFAARAGATLRPGAAVCGSVIVPPESALAIDDADAVPDAEALLHLLNASAEAGVPVLLAGQLPSSRWDFALPDLMSRLRAVTCVGLHAPGDTLLRSLLARLLAERQLVVPEPVQEFLLARLPRHGAALREVSLRLDAASLAAGGRVTRAMAADVLGVLEAADTGG